MLVDLDTRQVVWGRDLHARQAPASLTKMVTAMVAADLVSLDAEVTVTPEATAVEPNLMGLSAGEVLSVRELLHGLFLDSGNDAAEALARGIVGRDRFIGLMNRKAERLGLADSHFSNPTGLDDQGLQSSAYDLAVTATTLIDDYPELARIAGTKDRTIAATAGHKAFAPINLNKLLWSYPGANGLKTGFTDEAGGCVAASASRGGRRLVAVTLHSDVFFTDAGKLLDYGFSTSSSI